jgi:hypothetical protein
VAERLVDVVRGDESIINRVQNLTRVHRSTVDISAGLNTVCGGLGAVCVAVSLRFLLAFVVDGAAIRCDIS